ncbi:hypothetical protein XA68_18276 [Ophiocordyceps unilateralis]|uniref:Peptidase A1 domain-containing protein n=1 Tax=Ophiocordyceps unilateralis TaxID=268505 RepID=A0A2A9P3D1_OPHUN|nr:hypothetical protein XA68_18276 [Ophiocordyceps unilateralis]
MRSPRGAYSALLVTAGLYANLQVHGEAENGNDNGFKIPILNDRERGGYFINVTIGVPGQDMALQLDTGSSDVWVPSSNAKLCRKPGDGGCSLGSFNVEESDTFDNDTNSLFSIAYQDQSSSEGTYFKDQFLIGPASLPQFTMGLGARTTIPYGLAGVGYASDEAALATSPYGSMTWMPARGIFCLEQSTPRKARSPSGSDLLTSEELPLPVVLDSGTTFSYLPQNMANQVWEEVGASWEPQAGMALLPCSYASHPGQFSFSFAGPNGPRVSVSMDELVVPFTSGEAPEFESGPYRGQSACALGILNQTGPPYLLGDTFLRSAYVVYDLSNNEIGIAPTNFNTSKSNIVTFPSRGATIPSTTAVPNELSRPQVQPAHPSMRAARGFQASDSAASHNPLSTPDSVIFLILITLFW